MKITTEFGTYEVTATAAYYASNDSLAIVLDEARERFVTLTVNLDASDYCAKDCAFVDTNNCPWAGTFIRENALGVPTGRYAYSGFCIYPEYKFDLEKLKEDSK